MSASLGRCRAVRARRRASAGFTLVELTVALLAGLLVAMGIVGLSREATSTFHEEARSSAAEAALRTAVDRLRADLQRAGFMSTGNIAAAPRIAHNINVASNYPANAPASIKQLQSIALMQGGSASQNALLLSAQQPVPVAPDMIRISGNMTSADQFDVASVSTTAQSSCIRINLTPTSPALFRVMGAQPYSAASGAELRNVFFPTTGAPGAAQFIVRLVDTNQCAQYLQTCQNSQGAGLDAANLPYVDVDTRTPVVTANASGSNCGVTGFGEGSTVNPVQTVQWEITSQGGTDPEPAAYAGLGGPAAGKYDLMRSYVDADGNIVPDTSEIIAEYAVDLSFAFSVETGTALAPSIQTFAFDDPINATWAPFAPGAPAIANVGPQRIRSVRARLVTRTAIADRSVNIVPAPPNVLPQRFAYRYCVAPNGCGAGSGGGLQWARTRTITTEVALQNQAGNFY